MTFKPMLARSETLTQEDLHTLQYPVIVSPKLDGMRIFKHEGRVLTRNSRPLPNDHARAILEGVLPDGIDGELCLPALNEPLEDVMSAFKSKGGTPEFRYAAFDFVGEGNLHNDFWQRMRALSEHAYDLPHVLLLRQEMVKTPEEVVWRFENYLSEGFEGAMVRSPNGRYKQGRSTLKEGYLLKLKPWHDEEATIVDLIEECENTNEERTATGARSSAKAGKIGKNQLGAFACKFDDGTEFTVSGFTAEQKRFWWDIGLLGHRITVKHQVVNGGRAPGKAPRHPKFKCFHEDV